MVERPEAHSAWTKSLGTFNTENSSHALSAENIENAFSIQGMRKLSGGTASATAIPRPVVSHNDAAGAAASVEKGLGTDQGDLMHGGGGGGVGDGDGAAFSKLHQLFSSDKSAGQAARPGHDRQASGREEAGVSSRPAAQQHIASLDQSESRQAQVIPSFPHPSTLTADTPQPGETSLAVLMDTLGSVGSQDSLDRGLAALTTLDKKGPPKVPMGFPANLGGRGGDAESGAIKATGDGKRSRGPVGESLDDTSEGQVDVNAQVPSTEETERGKVATLSGGDVDAGHPVVIGGCDAAGMASDIAEELHCLREANRSLLAQMERMEADRKQREKMVSELQLKCKEGEDLRRALHGRVLDLAEVIRKLVVKVKEPMGWYDPQHKLVCTMFMPVPQSVRICL